jgi:hypothetical protein
MMSKLQAVNVRPQAAIVAGRLKEPRRFLRAVVGPRRALQPAAVRSTVGGGRLRGKEESMRFAQRENRMDCAICVVGAGGLEPSTLRM